MHKHKHTVEYCIESSTKMYQMFNRYSLKLKEVQETIGEEAWGKLQHKIDMCILKEVTRLLDILIQLKNICQDIENYLKNLQDARSKVFVEDEWMQILIKGTVHRPTLTNLLVWAMDAHQHYNQICLRITNCLDKFTYDAKDIEDLTVAFIENRSKRKHMQHILTFTQFLAKESPPPPPQRSEIMDSARQRKSRG